MRFLENVFGRRPPDFHKRKDLAELLPHFQMEGDGVTLYERNSQQIYNFSFKNLKIDNYNFAGHKLVRCDLRGADLTGTNLIGVVLDRCLLNSNTKVSREGFTDVVVIGTDVDCLRFPGGYRAVKVNPHATISKIKIVHKSELKKTGEVHTSFNAVASLAALGMLITGIAIAVEGQQQRENAVDTKPAANQTPGVVLGGTEEERQRVTAHFEREIAYWQTHYPDFEPPTLKIGSVEEGIITSCREGVIHQSAYCHPDRRIGYFPERNTKRARLENLDFELSERYTIAHEVAHSVQHFIQSPGITQTVNEVLEQEADCLAGRSLRAQFLQETNTKIVEKGVDELLKTMIALGDYHDSHGTGSERAKAFLKGYESGVCF